MHRHTVILKNRLAGISRAPGAEPAQPAPVPVPGSTPPGPPAVLPPAAPPLGSDVQAGRQVLAELTRLLQAVQAQDRRTLGDVAQMSVELGTAIAERLVHQAIAADRQRLERIVAGMLERMPVARFVIVRGHADDLALLQRQLSEQGDQERYRDVLSFRPEPTCQRGQLKLDADEWFIEWDTPRALAELRAALLEETFEDD